MSDSKIRISADVQDAKRAFREIRREGDMTSSSFVKTAQNYIFSAKNQKMDSQAFNQTFKNINTFQEKIQGLSKSLLHLRSERDAALTATSGKENSYTQAAAEEISRLEQRQAGLQGYIKRARRGELEGVPAGEGGEGGEGGMKALLLSRLGPAALAASGIMIFKKSADAVIDYNESLVKMTATLAGSDKHIQSAMAVYSDLMGHQNTGEISFFQSLKALKFNQKDIASYMAQAAAAGGGPEGQQGGGLALEAGFGVDRSNVFSLISANRRGGKGTSDRDLAVILGESMKSGVSDALRRNEFYEAVSNLTSQQQALGVNADANKIGSLLSILGAAGGPMFQGALGGQVASQMNQGFLNPGGGIAGQLFALRSAGLGKGGNLLQARLQLEQGLSNPNNLIGALQNAQMYGTEGGIIPLSQTLGISLNQAQILQKANKNGDLVSKLQNMNPDQYQQYVSSALGGAPDLATAAVNRLEKRGGADLTAALETTNSTIAGFNSGLIQLGKNFQYMIDGLRTSLDKNTTAVNNAD